MAHVSYIEGDVPILGLDHFVHAHILHEELDYTISMLYAGGSKALWLPDLMLALYSYHQLTLQLAQTRDAGHSYSGPPRTRLRALLGQHSRTPQHQRLTLSSPSGTLDMWVDTRSTRRAVVLTTLTFLLGSAVEQGPPPLHGTPTGITPLRGILVMGQTKQTRQWKELDDFSTRWGSFIPPSAHRPT
jgi:hypothetical protein